MSELNKKHIFKCAQYDKHKQEVFLLFSKDFKTKNKDEKKEIRDILQRVMVFNKFRNRPWRIIYFRSPKDGDEYDLLSQEQLSDKWYKGITYVYQDKPHAFKRLFGVRNTENSFENLHTYMKQQNDSRLT